MSLQRNVRSKLLLLPVLLIKFITPKQKPVKNVEQHQCAHLLHLIGIQLILDVCNAHPKNLHLMNKQSNVKLALLVQYGQLFIIYVFLNVLLDNNIKKNTKNVLNLIKFVVKNKYLASKQINV
jgi:hypothetical protein